MGQGQQTPTLDPAPERGTGRTVRSDGCSENDDEIFGHVARMTGDPAWV